MKRIIFFLILSLLAALTFAQQVIDIVHLKDGSTIKGQIIEEIPGKSYKIRTTNGSEVVFLVDEIDRISHAAPEVLVKDYGSPQGFGISLMGPGLIGLSYRLLATPDRYLEFGAHYNGVITDGWYDDEELHSALALSVTTDMILNRFYKEEKRKVKANGVFLAGAYTLGRFNNTFIGAGWVHESFRAKNQYHSFLLELGPGLRFNHWTDDPENKRYDSSDIEFNIYLKLQWNFYSGMEK